MVTNRLRGWWMADSCLPIKNAFPKFAKITIWQGEGNEELWTSQVLVDGCLSLEVIELRLKRRRHWAWIDDGWMVSRVGVNEDANLRQFPCELRTENWAPTQPSSLMTSLGYILGGGASFEDFYLLLCWWESFYSHSLSGPVETESIFRFITPVFVTWGGYYYY